VAVFRFTLGIPGFDDSNIPRVVGAAVALLVAINHAVVADPPPAQVKRVCVCLRGGGGRQMAAVCDGVVHLCRVAGLFHT
jgi:hypothetical protein